MLQVYTDDAGQAWTPMANGTRTRVTYITCGFCEKDFPVVNCRVGKAKYCSRTCACGRINERCYPRGRDCSQWRGGRKFDNGYIRIYTDHPRSDKKGYMMEHRLVMEQKIGRLLERHEQVHHINGIKDDNRPENLELWSKSHPSGVRSHDKHCPTCTCGASESAQAA